MKKRVLVTDVDNTLFDWVNIWHSSFSAMLDKIVEMTGISPDDLYPDIRAVHQKYHTSEYAFLLEEIPLLQNRYGDRLFNEIQPAIDAFREARRKSLILYPRVERTLATLREAGIVIVAYTESLSFYTGYRFRKLGLDRLVDFLYSPPDHELPLGEISGLRKYPPESYKLHTTIHRHTPPGELKPNPDILLSILKEIGASPEEAVYVGDSPMKDIVMAQKAGVYDVLAAYGAAQHREQYDLLREVTHWSKEDVEREREILQAGRVTPTMTLDDDLSSVLSLFDLEYSDHG